MKQFTYGFRTESFAGLWDREKRYYSIPDIMKAFYLIDWQKLYPHGVSVYIVAYLDEIIISVSDKLEIYECEQICIN